MWPNTSQRFLHVVLCFTIFVYTLFDTHSNGFLYYWNISVHVPCCYAKNYDFTIFSFPSNLIVPNFLWFSLKKSEPYIESCVSCLKKGFMSQLFHSFDFLSFTHKFLCKTLSELDILSPCVEMPFNAKLKNIVSIKSFHQKFSCTLQFMLVIVMHNEVNANIH